MAVSCIPALCGLVKVFYFFDVSLDGGLENREAFFNEQASVRSRLQETLITLVGVLLRQSMLLSYQYSGSVPWHFRVVDVASRTI